MDKLERLASLYLSFLNHPEGLSFSKIRKMVPLAYQGDFEAARRKFERDKDELKKLGMELRYVSPSESPLGHSHQGEEHIYVPAEEFRWMPDLSLSDEESGVLSSLLVESIQRFEKSDDEFASLLRSAALKLLYRAPVIASPGENPERFSLSSRTQTGESSDTLMKVHEALHEHKQLRFSYPSRNGEIRDRVAEGRGLLCRRGRWYLVAVDASSREIRSFALDRMKGLDITNVVYGHDPDFNIRDHSLHPLALRVEEPVHFHFRITSQGRDTILDYLSSAPLRMDVKIEDELVSLTTTNPGAFFSFLIVNPDVVDAMGPKEIHNRFLDYRDQILKLYENLPEADHG